MMSHFLSRRIYPGNAAGHVLAGMLMTLLCLLVFVFIAPPGAFAADITNSGNAATAVSAMPGDVPPGQKSTESADAPQDQCSTVLDSLADQGQWVRLIETAIDEDCGESCSSFLELRQQIARAFSTLYREKKLHEILAVFREHEHFWEAHPRLLPRLTIGKTFFKMGRYHESLQHFEQWYADLSEVADRPTRTDPRFFIVRTLVYLYPSIALSYVVTILLSFLMPMLAFIVYAVMREDARRFHRSAFVVSGFLFLAQLMAHIQLDILTMRTFFIVLTVLVRNFLFIAAGFALAERAGLPVMPLISSYRDSNGRPFRARVGRDTVTILLALGACSFLLGVMFRPQESMILTTVSRYFQSALLDISHGESTTLMTFVYVIVAAVVEELTVRLFGLSLIVWLWSNTVATRFMAITVTSLLWSLAHAGLVEPEIFKIIQVFVAGLAFGWLALRRGIESSILAHSIFNGVGMIVMITIRGLP